MIRKSGLLVFLALLAVVLAMVYLFAGFALRLGMVYSLEKVAGAEVNIDKVSVSLAPLALNIRGLEITDKNLPTHNSVSFDKAQAAIVQETIDDELRSLSSKGVSDDPEVLAQNKFRQASLLAAKQYVEKNTEVGQMKKLARVVGARAMRMVRQR